MTSAEPSSTRAIPETDDRRTAAGDGGSESVTADTGAEQERSNEERMQYRARLIDALRGNQRYPMRARQRRLEGTVVVRFQLDANGTVLAREILESSGIGILDQAALESIDRASPFPAPPPIYLSGQEAWFAVPIGFRLR
ncbi:MAG: energy transducer TonB [Burkholderiaceae bacterium]